jgi:hypothetical protein
MKRNNLLIFFAVGAIVWSCTKVDTQSQSQNLKQSIEKNVNDINAAINAISANKGYQLLSLNTNLTGKDMSVMGPMVFNDSLTLATVAGIYNYQPDTIHLYHNFAYPFRLFKKVGTSNLLIVNLPQKLIFHPKYLHSFTKSDSILKNDFTITATDYHFYHNSWNSVDYKLSADLALNSVDLGSFDISNVSHGFQNNVNSSKYNFTGGYGISTTWQTGDTSKFSFSFLKDKNPLLLETSLFTKSGTHKREKQYDLTIGNIEIKRGFGIDSIQVFQNGVLQKKAGAKITDSADSTGTIFMNRDIVLTFDDGTTTKLSTLLGPPLTQLKTIVGSLQDMYFAKNIVDYIAMNIFFNSR